MPASDYLRSILARERVETGPAAPARAVGERVARICSAWAGKLLVEVRTAGSFSKGTANLSSTHVDFVALVSPRASYGVEELYRTMAEALTHLGYEPERRNVALGISIGGVNADIIPAKLESLNSSEVMLYRSRSGKPVRTDLAQHVIAIKEADCADEIRLLKLWRDQRGLDFPSLYLELTVRSVLRQKPREGLAENFWTILGYLQGEFTGRAVLDPANSNNIISDELGMGDKARIRLAAQLSRNGLPWDEIIS